MSRTVGSIRRSRDFAALAASRQRGRSGCIRVARAPLDDPGEERIAVGYAIGRAVGPAVVRNRIRRRLRVLMRDRVDDTSLAPGLAPGRYLVSVGPAAADASFADLRHHLRVALAQLS